MGWVRFRVAWRGLVELHEVLGQDLMIGSDPRCDLVITHPTVARRHAKVLIRRGRLLLLDVGQSKQGTTRGKERLAAPVTLAPGESFGVGEVQVRAWSIAAEERGLVGQELPQGRVVAELESFDPALRLYRVEAVGGRAELMVPQEAAQGVDFWRARLNRALAARLAPGTSLLELDGAPALLEPIPDGIRLNFLLEAVEAGRCQLPPSMALLALFDLLEGLIALSGPFGPHGALAPCRAHLGTDGMISLLRPGPQTLPQRSDHSPPERGPLADPPAVGPSAAADLYALGVILKRLTQASGPGGLAALNALAVWFCHADPSCRPASLEEAHAAAQEVARALPALGQARRQLANLVRLLCPDSSRTLGRAQK